MDGTKLGSPTMTGKPATPTNMAEQHVPSATPAPQTPKEAEPKVVVKGQDMPDEMRKAAVEVAVNVSYSRMRQRIAKPVVPQC